MRSISTMRGDGGETSLAGGVRVSKGSLRVETYGTVDELNSSLGFARSICEDAEIAAFTKGVQQDLFRIGSSLATPAESPKPQIVIDPALTERLTDEVHRLEAIEGMLADWSIPGEHRAAAAFDVARTICRRAERSLVRFQESGAAVQPAILLVRQQIVRRALALRPQARTRRRRQRIAAGRDRKGRQPLLTRLVAGATAWKPLEPGRHDTTRLDRAAAGRARAPRAGRSRRRFPHASCPRPRASRRRCLRWDSAIGSSVSRLIAAFRRPWRRCRRWGPF